MHAELVARATAHMKALQLLDKLSELRLHLLSSIHGFRPGYYNEAQQQQRRTAMQDGTNLRPVAVLLQRHTTSAGRQDLQPHEICAPDTRWADHCCQCRSTSDTSR